MLEELKHEVLKANLELCERNLTLLTWGNVSGIAWNVEIFNPSVKEISKAILDKHYLRKHGATSYYGQKENKINLKGG